MSRPLNTYSLDQTWAGIRSTYVQTNTGLIYATPRIKTASQNPITGAMSYTERQTKGIYVDKFSLAPDAATITAFGYRIHNDCWIAGQWDDSDAGSRFVADTANAQTAASGFATGPKATVTPADDDGMVIGCIQPFQWMDFNLTTDDIGGLPDVVVEYSTRSLAGVPAWTTVVAPPWYIVVDQLTRTDTVIGTGSTYYVALNPITDSPDAPQSILNWAKWTDREAATIDASLPGGYFYMRARVDANDPPTTDFGITSGMEIGGIFPETLHPLTVDNVMLNWDIKREIPNADGIVAFNTAAAGLHTVTCAPLWGG